MRKESLNERVVRIKKNKDEINKLIEEYKPFIASTVEKHIGRFVEYGFDDELGIALIAFNESIQKYEMDKGNFLSFAKIVIKNRLTDYYRKEQRKRGKEVYLENTGPDGEESTRDVHISESIKRYEQEAISRARREEILDIKKELMSWGLTFADVAESSPKQGKTRKTYITAIKYVLETPEVLKTFKIKKYLPIAKISKGTKIHRKKLERGRNYIVAALIILSGDYQHIKEYVKWR